MLRSRRWVILLLFEAFLFILLACEGSWRNLIESDDRLRNVSSEFYCMTGSPAPSRNISVLHTLLGSLTKTYFPSGIFIQRSVTVRTIPHPLASDTLSCAANSVGRTEAVLRMTCRLLSRGLAREMYLKTDLLVSFGPRVEYQKDTYPTFKRSAPAITL